MKELQGKTALVTGASSGLGVEFARELAGRGADVVLVARREERLRALAEELARDAGVGVAISPRDLARPEERLALFEELERRGTAVDVLVNNAGFGLFGPFLDLAWEKEQQMLELDVLALVDLTKRFARPMAARGWGRILQVSSVGAYQPTPTYASYAAAKSFVLNFGEALRHELRGTGVSCTVVSPGATRTEFFEVSGQRLAPYHRAMMMGADQVAKAAVNGLLAGRATVVPGRLNALTACLTARVMPRNAAAALAARLMKA
jgi:short-subunit dehydrogenase